jgi:DNA uptake protein ComE-like DNA-binding protein
MKLVAAGRGIVAGLALALVIGGCSVASDGSDTEDTTASVIAENSRQAYGVLHFLNSADATYPVLRNEVGLTATAAKNIAQHTKGAEWQGGKIASKGVDPAADDDPLGSVAELDAIPGVGSATMKKLVSYATVQGLIPDVLADGVPLTNDEATDIVDVANTASLADLKGAGLQSTAASSLVAARPYDTIDEVAAAPHIGKVAITHLHELAQAVNAPAFGASGPATKAAFYQLSVDRLPVSQAVTDIASGAAEGNFIVVPGRYSLPPSTLKQIVQTPDRLQHFAFDLLFITTGTDWASGLTATATPIATPGAFDSLRAKLFDGWGPDEIGQKDQPFKTLVNSMVKDFKGSSVQLYLLHWDNSDDTRFEGLAAVNTTTGEVRVLSVDFPG